MSCWLHQVSLLAVIQDLLRLPELFSPGMLVRCVVSSLDVTESGKKSVKLSMNPKRVNKVLSAEALRPGMVCIWVPLGRGASLLRVWSEPPFSFCLMAVYEAGLSGAVVC